MHIASLYSSKNKNFLAATTSFEVLKNNCHLQALIYSPIPDHICRISSQAHTGKYPRADDRRTQATGAGAGALKVTTNCSRAAKRQESRFWPLLLLDWRITIADRFLPKGGLCFAPDAYQPN
ncbi:MAG TPA: hypothetical protein VJW20_21840 [Candidatus Angelobacter sp.]|nr:hypothetical protein [Candidatus Angelobacter sp.]